MLSTGSSLLIKTIQEERLRDFSKLKKDWFHREEHKLYDFILGFTKQYGKLPGLDVLLKKQQIANEKLPETYGYYYDEFVNRLIYTTVNDELGAVNHLLTNRDGRGVLEKLRSIISKADTAQAESSQDVMLLHELGSKVIEQVKISRMMDGITGVPTGWPFLDAATRGFQKKDITVILARVKSGKSQVIVNLANQAHMAGFIPMVISMEMSDIQLGNRMIALRAGINMDSVNTGQVSHWGEQKLIQTVRQLKEGLPYYFIEGQFKKDINEIVALIHSYRPHVVYIDGGYLIKMRGTERMQKWERIGEIVEILKTTAANEDIPIVVSFQFNRQVTRKTKSVEGDAFEKIQLSDAISQIATTGIAILDDDMGQEKVKILEIIGGRNGEKGRFKINWDWERMNFSQITDEFSDPTEDLIQW